MDLRSVSLAMAVAVLAQGADGALVLVSPPSSPDDFAKLDSSRLNDTQKEIQDILNMPDDQAFAEVRRLDELVDRLTSGVDASIERGDEAVSLVVRVPDLSEQSVEVTVGQRRVTLSYARQEPPGTPHEWRFFQPKTISLPVPADADYRTARVTRGQDSVRITFTKRA